MTNPMMPVPHKIISVTKETEAEYTFRVACDHVSGMAAQHGRFFQLSIPKVGEAPISVSGRGDGWLEFTIRKVGRLTAGVFGLRPGDTLFMRGPYGNCWPVDKFDGTHLVVITGGTGLAPVRTLLNHYVEQPDKVKSVWLIAGFRDISCVLFAEDLLRFKKAFHTICTLDTGAAEGAGLGFDGGMVTAHIPKIPFHDFDDHNVLIVGPPVMMRFASKACLDAGAEEEKMWLSFERKMSCAVGKCGHCKINETYVCLEGPVFNYIRAKELVD